MLIIHVISIKNIFIFTLAMRISSAYCRRFKEKIKFYCPTVLGGVTDFSHFCSYCRNVRGNFSRNILPICPLIDLNHFQYQRMSKNSNVFVQFEGTLLSFANKSTYYTGRQIDEQVNILESIHNLIRLGHTCTL